MNITWDNYVGTLKDTISDSNTSAMRQITFLSFAILLIGVMLPFASLAQTGPGGVGNSTTLRCWVSASSGVFTDLGVTEASNNETIRQWSDLSGNGNNLTQSTASNRPTLITGQLNGQPVVRFDGTNDVIDATLGVNPTETSVFVTGNFSTANQSTGDFDYMINIGTSFSDGISISRNTSERYYSFTENETRTGPILSTSYQTFHQEFTASNPFHFLRINGSSQSVTAHNAQISIGQNLRLGGMLLSTGLNFLTGDIAEVIVYSSNLNTTQRILVENYLDANYGLGSSSDKYAFEGTHGNELAGIGRESSSDNHTQGQGTSIVRIRDANSLGDGDYLMWGHDGGALTTNSVDVPASYSGSGGMRLSRVWRADESNTDVGDMTVIFVMTGIDFGTDPNLYELLTDDNGVFTDATSTGMSPTISGDSVIFSNVNIPDNHYFTIGNTDAVNTCASFMDGLWPAVIWDCAPLTPDSTRNAIVSVANSVTITDAQSVNDLTIEGTLNINASGSLIVKGDITVSATGSVVFDESSTVIMRGNAGQQTITNNSASAVVFGNLEINNNDGAELAAGGEIHLSSGLSLTDGTLTCSQTLRMLSVSGRQSAVVSVGTGSLGGTIQMDRFIDGRLAAWSTMSAPITNADFESIDDDIFISGVTGGDGTAAGFISMWSYDEVANSYTAVSNTTDPMESGRGYEIWLATDISAWNAATLDYTGSPDVSEQVISLNTTGGWNLIGNPYPAFLDWTNVSDGVTGISGDQYFIYDQATSQYVAHGDGTNIPPGQGFWVNSSVSSLTLTPANDFANSSSSSFFKAGYISTLPELTIGLESVNDKYAHNAYVRREPMAFDGFDEFDMTMLRSPDSASCEVALESDVEDLLVSYVPAEASQLSIPFHVTAGTPGAYSLKLDGFENLSEYSCVNLLDKQTNTQVSVSSGFELNVMLEENNPQHFELLLVNAGVADCVDKTAATENDPLDIYAFDKDVLISYYLDRSTGANVEVFDLMGNRVHNVSHTAGYNRERISLSNAASGVYFVNVTFNNGATFSRKVFIQ